MLIKCPDCGKMFSEYADCCPICGCPTNAAKASSEQKREEEEVTTKPFTPNNEIVEVDNDSRKPQTPPKYLSNNYKRYNKSEVHFLFIVICIALFILLVLLGFIMHNKQSSLSNGFYEKDADTVTITQMPAIDVEEKEDNPSNTPMTFFTLMRFNSGYEGVPEDVLDASRSLEIRLTPPNEVTIIESIQDDMTYKGTYELKDSIITMNVKGLFEFAITGIVNNQELTITRCFCLNNEEYNNEFLGWDALTRRY